MAGKKKFISEPGEIPARQSSLCDIPGTRVTGLTHAVYPRIERSSEQFREILQSPCQNLGIDLEFEGLRPTIVAVSTPERIVSVPCDSEIRGLLSEAFQRDQYRWVAHSGVSADRPVVESWCGIQTPLRAWDDSMITHYLCNQHLTKAPSKEETDDSGVLGFMNLWAMASLVTDVWNWKSCRGVMCDGPCPTHDPVGYCGLDSWAGIVGFEAHQETMQTYGVPQSLYRESMELSEICYKMETQGVAVDRQWVQEFEEGMDSRKSKLFPEDAPFNPLSNVQTVRWFNENGIPLKGNSKKEVAAMLEKQLWGLGYKDLVDFAANAEEDLPENVDWLYRLSQIKSEGKGLDPWFHARYFGKDGLLHPRFIMVGTSSARLSSSRPNLMNVAVRGWASSVRQAIIPRSPDYVLVKSDGKQLELRVVLWYAGVDPVIMGSDAFYWLVDEAGEGFLKAAAWYDSVGYAKDPRKAARNIAKIISHGSDYLMGIKIHSFEDLEKNRVRDQITAGALRPYLRKYMPQLKRDWTFEGDVVCFTGVKLAEDLFGSATWENRKKALEIQEDVYFKKFFGIREWQMRVSEEIETTGCIKSATGRFLRMFGNAEDRLKVAAAFLGQGTGADHMHAIMLRYKREQGVVPLLQVHDELVFERPRSETRAQLKDFLRIMKEPTWRIPGLAVPCESKVGDNWKDMQVVE